MVCGNRKGQMFVWNANAGAGYVRGGDGADGGGMWHVRILFPKSGDTLFYLSARDCCPYIAIYSYQKGLLLHTSQVDCLLIQLDSRLTLSLVGIRCRPRCSRSFRKRVYSGVFDTPPWRSTGGAC